MRKTTAIHHLSEEWHRRVLKTCEATLLLIGALVFHPGATQAEPNTGSNARSPKCQAEYDQCAKNCDKTQIDVGNQIQQCKNKCAADTDLYCSRTLTSGGSTGTAPKASVGTLQNVPANPPTKTPPTNAAPKTGGTQQVK